MKHMTRNQASNIFKARTRMLECKMNFKNKYKGNLNCRFCETTEESQRHILEECIIIHTDKETKIIIGEIFKEEPKELQKTADKLQYILEKLEVQVPSANHTGSHPDIGECTHRKKRKKLTSQMWHEVSYYHYELYYWVVV